ncbi:MAG TPA: DUF1801 domain-containing protein [Pyrinomonadaceae bacterium]|nr:DUF1801 domain-containing protein [Pyrinomonadaceae bacterium]
MANSTTEFDDLLSAYPDTVQETARAARKFILETVPQALEMVDAPARVIGYGQSANYKDLICTIILSKSGVKLGIVGGAALPDPNGLMEGAGKKHRYVVLDTAADLKRPGLKQLIKGVVGKLK